jgi:alkylation response protein AidB-like acyl-CoA dehydrogenase
VVVAEELAAAKAPAPIGFSGVDILGPALIAHGTPEQKARFLPPILRGEELWCQGYSEPGSGSDLASMSTRAVTAGDDFVVTGQKTWTSYGSRADWCFLLVRTGTAESRNRGITFLLAPMTTPGIEWHPTKQLLGDAHFGDLFLDEARVPRANVVGGEGAGWGVAMHSLAHERILSGNVVPLRTRLDALARLARARGADPSLRNRIAGLEADVLVAGRIQARALDLAAAGDPAFGAWAAMVKLSSTELRQKTSLVAADLLGPALVAGDDPDGAAWRHELLDARAATIYAGTSEVQRNIIAEQGLGLPREPRP